MISASRLFRGKRGMYLPRSPWRGRERDVRLHVTCLIWQGPRGLWVKTNLAREDPVGGSQLIPLRQSSPSGGVTVGGVTDRAAVDQLLQERLCAAAVVGHRRLHDGTGEIECDGKTTQVGPGAIMYCAGNVLHGIVNTGKVPMTFYWSKWLAKGF